jgi:hypothetical protein
MPGGVMSMQDFPSNGITSRRPDASDADRYGRVQWLDEDDGSWYCTNWELIASTRHPWLFTLRKRMDDLNALDEKILEHLRSNGQSHPFSSPDLRKLAADCLRLVRTEDPCRLLEARMKGLRDAKRLHYERLGKRYVVNDKTQHQLTAEPPTNQ